MSSPRPRRPGSPHRWRGSGKVLATLTAAVLTLGAAAAPAAATAGPTAVVPPTESDSESYFHNEEIAVGELDPTGLPVRTDIIGRISSRGIPEQTLLDPFTTANVEFLNEWGSPDVVGDGVQVTVGGPEPQTVLLLGLMDKPLPVAMHAQYELDGEVVDPEAVLGASGELTVKLTVTNIDVEKQEISYTDAVGKRTTEELPVFAPLTGSLITKLPPDWEPTSTSGATLSSNESGETVLRWNLVLYPPLGDFTQEVSYRARVENGSIPATILSLAPTSTDKNPAGAFSQDLLEKSVAGNEELSEGLAALNDSTLALADGVARLSDGLIELAAGAASGSQSVNSQLVPGAQQLAAGTSALAEGQAALADALADATAGASGLSEGADNLADGMQALSKALGGLASDGLPQIQDGAQAIADGANQLADAIGADAEPVLPTIPPGPLPTGIPSPSLPSSPIPIPTPSGSPVFPTPTLTPPREPTLYEATQIAVLGTRLLRDQLVKLNNDLIPVLAAIAVSEADSNDAAASATDASARLGPLITTLCTPPLNPPTPAECAELAAAEQQAAAAGATSSKVAADLHKAQIALAKSSLRAYLAAAGSDQLLTLLKQIRSGVKQAGLAIRSGSTEPGQEGIVEGLDALVVALGLTVDAAEQLSDGAKQLGAGTDGVSAGAAELADGLGQAESGADTLAGAGSELAEGAALTAFGTAEVGRALAALAGGIGEAADGSAQLADGAGKLQQEGMQKLLDSVIASSAKPAQAVAYLKAANARADTAMPYGPPEGATGSAAYILTMSPVMPGSSGRWLLIALVVLVMAAVGGAVVKQVRSTSGS